VIRSDGRQKAAITDGKGLFRFNEEGPVIGIVATKQFGRTAVRGSWNLSTFAGVVLLADRIEPQVRTALSGMRVQYFTDYTLERPMGTLTFRPKAESMPARSIALFDRENISAALLIQSLLKPAFPGIQLVQLDIEQVMKTDVYFATWVRNNKVTIQISLLDSSSRRGNPVEQRTAPNPGPPTRQQETQQQSAAQRQVPPSAFAGTIPVALEGAPRVGSEIRINVAVPGLKDPRGQGTNPAALRAAAFQVIFDARSLTLSQVIEGPTFLKPNVPFVANAQGADISLVSQQDYLGAGGELATLVFRCLRPGNTVISVDLADFRDTNQFEYEIAPAKLAVTVTEGAAAKRKL
jgi:hypothetical protein